jgi:hypothetical protein
MSNFYCCCGNEDYEHAELYNETFPIAKKEHECVECGEPILPGQKYHRVEGKWEGHWGTYKTCYPCYHIREDYCECGFIFGELVESIWNCLGFNYLTNESYGDDNKLW